jgi:hypothetical protein
MGMSDNKKSFIQDQEVLGVKDKEMLRKQDVLERDELARRLVEKDKLGKGKLTKNNPKGVTLSQ